MEINEKLFLVHNTRHASGRHRGIGKDTNSTSPWISRFDLIIDTYLNWRPGMPPMKKVKTVQKEPPRTVFVKTNHLKYFIKEILPSLDSEFVLYLGNADKSIRSRLNPEEVDRFLNEDKITKIFSEQNDVDSEKVISMPEGMHPAPLLKYHDDLERISLAAEPSAKKNIVCGGWSPWGKTIFGTRTDRVDAEKYMKENKDFCYFFSGVSHVEFWQTVCDHRFFLSPLGTTYDSFKTFEALAVKTIPIIQRLGVWQKAHEDLPVVVIDDFSEINPENLDRWWNELSPQLESVMDKLKIDYWWNKVNG
jgi:hypothetical protein